MGGKRSDVRFKSTFLKEGHRYLFIYSFKIFIEHLLCATIFDIRGVSEKKREKFLSYIKFTFETNETERKNKVNFLSSDNKYYEKINQRMQKIKELPGGEGSSCSFIKSDQGHFIKMMI